MEVTSLVFSLIVRFIFIESSGEEIYGAEIAGGYLHHGKSKGFTIDIPQEKCINIKYLKVDIKTDRLSIGERLDLGKEMCKP